MKRFSAKANLNPAFKVVQPLPLVNGHPLAVIPAGGAVERPEGAPSTMFRGLAAPPWVVGPGGNPDAGLFASRMPGITSPAYASVLPESTFRR